MNATSNGKPLLLYGGGGHGLVVAEAAEASGWRVAGFIDDHVAVGQAVGEWSIVALPKPGEAETPLIIAIGENLVRERVMRKLVDLRYRFETVIHPTAWISPTAKIGAGVYVGPLAIVNARAHIGDGAIINSATIIEHHCRVGEFAHIAPNAALGGNVEVGQKTLIGIGASVRPGAVIGKSCVIGAGAAVVSDVPDKQTFIGVPARKKK